MAGNAVGYVAKCGGALAKSDVFTASTAVNGVGVDTTGFTHATGVFTLGTVANVASSTLTLKVQESDDDSTYADITGATSGALTTAAGTYSKATVVIVVNLLSGSRKRYVRVVALPSAHAVDVDVAGMVALTEGDASVPTATTYLRVNV
jgi:hypothetical protein